MPTLSWNEIRQRSIAFSRSWSDAGRERAESQSFWNDFFDVFGIRRRTVASFEEPVKNLKGRYDFIDVFWKGRLLCEHKSAGKSLDKAASQAFQYIQELAAQNRHEEIPRYVVVSDFASLVLYDLEPEETAGLPVFEGRPMERHDFALADFHRHIRLFAFLAGYTTQRRHEEDPANLEAAAIMAGLHDELRELGYTGQDLERFLVRLLFCLFAEDTGIFDPSQFGAYIRNHSREDGSGLGPALSELFQVLDTPPDRRMKNLDEDLAAFKYIDGALFRETIRIPSFSRTMREKLLGASERFKWEKISPAVFGSLFQGVMDAKERRSIGAHYTSERDILKLIGPLFLDGLRAEFEAIRQDRSTRREQRLLDFQKKLASLRFLDPACGCGNFLVIAYRELRRLELEVLRLRYRLDAKERAQELPYGEIAKLSLVDVDQFCGIEIDPWPARIAETALWLMDHQMNTELSQSVGNLFQRIPLDKAPNIRCANALRLDWNEVLPAKECSYILGNPPFVGKSLMTAEQKGDVERVWGDSAGIGTLDYVTCWYRLAAGYIADNPSIECAFVSTSSISQGEQVGVLWSRLFRQNVKIRFAHRTFRWESEAKGKAHVHVVIIGFGIGERPGKTLFEYTNETGTAQATPVGNISPYLFEGTDTFLLSRTTPICEVPPTIYGNKPADGGHLILDDTQKQQVLARYPELAPIVQPMISAEEYLHGQSRWCLWIGDSDLPVFGKHPFVRERLDAVRAFRESSTKAPTRALAALPFRFAEVRQPEHNYLLIPRHSSENRRYIPFGYFSANIIVHDSCTALPNATPYHFGVLTSAMHMAWVRQVCGRLESRYRYSANLVYNNFPWPVEASAAHKDEVAERAQAVLDARRPFLDAGSTLADLYDPLTMPGALLAAHQALDHAVDKCYRREPFESERKRVEFLFELYEKLTAPLAAQAKDKRRKRAKE